MIIVGVGNFVLWNIWVCMLGDSFYILGQVYVNFKDGELIGFYQYMFNDVWDFLGNNEIILFDYIDKDGKIYCVGVYVDRNGFFYVIDVDVLFKCGGDINWFMVLLNVFFFVDGIIWVKGIDLQIGCFIENEGQCLLLFVEGEDKGVMIEVLLLFFGGKNWNLMVYSKKIGLFYVFVNYWKEDYWIENVIYQVGVVYLGQGFWIKKLFDDYIGMLCVFDLVMGEKKWEYKE